MYCIVPIHQEKKWETWELPRLLFGKANRKKKNGPTNGTWDSGVEHFGTFFSLLFFSLLSFPSRFFSSSPPCATVPFGRRSRSERFLYRLFCMCVCAIVVYPRAPENHRAV